MNQRITHDESAPKSALGVDRMGRIVVTPTPWQHYKIVSVWSSAFSEWWVEADHAYTCIPKRLYPQEPQVGDTISFIRINSLVLCCAIGEKLLWDDREPVEQQS